MASNAELFAAIEVKTDEIVAQWSFGCPDLSDEENYLRFNLTPAQLRVAEEAVRKLARKEAVVAVIGSAKAKAQAKAKAKALATAQANHANHIQTLTTLGVEYDAELDYSMALQFENLALAGLRTDELQEELDAA